jgi:hypothetical protein
MPRDFFDPRPEEQNIVIPAVRPRHSCLSVETLLALFTITIGIVLRVRQYAANPSIWVDEAAIARNVLDRSVLQLFSSLDYGQVAPPGFLLGVKFSATVFGLSEYSLRLVPFIAGIASPVLFFLIARSILRTTGAFVAMVMFSTALPLIFFSSNLKQYSSDVAVTLLVTAVALRLHRAMLTARSALAFGLVAGLVLFFSQAAVFALTIAGAAVFVDAFLDQRSDRLLRLGVVITWAVFVGVSVGYAFWIMKPIDDVYLHLFWADSFVPAGGTLTWIWSTIQAIFAGDGALHYSSPLLFAVLTVIGSVAICTVSPFKGTLVVGPIVLALAAAAVHAYPFGLRVSLFLLPLLLIVAAAGAEWAGLLLIRRNAGEYCSVVLLPFAVAACVQQPHPRAPEHLRPVMKYVADNWRPGDALWVYYGAAQAFKYYAHLIPIQGDVDIGDCNQTDSREYLRQVDLERGKPRVWVLMAHNSPGFRFDERQLLTSYLDTIGQRLDEFHAPPEDTSPARAAVLLYDLSIDQKLMAASAETFNFHNGFPPWPWTCYGTMSPLGPNERVVKAVRSEHRNPSFYFKLKQMFQKVQARTGKLKPHKS